MKAASAGNGVIVGMYAMGPNQPGLRSHIASATYLVHPQAQRHGVGRALVEHSLARARNEGYYAMQYNFVVSTNRAALSLYQKPGFIVVGTLPNAFRYQDRDWVDAYVMYHVLQQKGADQSATRDAE